MILSTYQPYFSPFPGFFYKAHQSDIFVLLDSVQLPRGTTWITRNRFKNDQGTLWMTIPIWKKGLGLQNIDAVRICHEGHWSGKHVASLRQAYGNAPYFGEHLDFVKDMFSTRFVKIIDLNLEIIRYLMQYLTIEVKLDLLSNLGIRKSGIELLIKICRYYGAKTYLAQHSARKYLDENQFQNAGIELRFFKTPEFVYPQLWGDFIAGLSTFDLIFNCGPKSRELLFARN
jgi:hypothetical protein